MIFQHYSYIHVCNSNNPINWLKQPKFFLQCAIPTRAIYMSFLILEWVKSYRTVHYLALSLWIFNAIFLPYKSTCIKALNFVPSKFDLMNTVTIDYTVKIFQLFQPVKGCLSCTHVQRSNDNNHSIKYHISNK